MGDYILIYDSSKDDTTDIAHNRAPEVGAKAIGVDSVSALKTELTRLKDSGVRIDRLLFYTHGEPGTIFFGTDTLLSTNVASEFAGNGFEDLFLPHARINFDGCNVASVKEGCEVGKNCSKTDNGTVFLTSVAKTFLFKGGGRAVGWTSNGFGFPSLGGSVMHHFSGTAVHIFVSKGGSRTRIGVGRVEMWSPLGWWEVKIVQKTFYYRFQSPAKVIYNDSFRSEYSTPTGKGVWKMDNDGVKIAWESGETEIWDTPLFAEYQTGTAMDLAGFDLSVIARQTTVTF